MGTGETVAEGAAETQAGSTIHNIAAARHTATEQQQTGLAALRGATPLRIAKLVQGNSSAAKAAICPAIGQVPASVTGPVVRSARVTDSVEAGQTALEAETSHGVAEGTETHSEEVPGVLGDTTDPARVPTAIAAPPAWDREAEADAAVVAGADEMMIIGQARWGRLK